jgi:hypothetical protein
MLGGILLDTIDRRVQATLHSKPSTACIRGSGHLDRLQPDETGNRQRRFDGHCEPIEVSFIRAFGAQTPCSSVLPQKRKSPFAGNAVQLSRFS